MKRFFAFLLAVCLLLSAAPCQTRAAQIASGDCGEADWQMDSDGTLYIIGSGRMLYHGGWDNSAIRKVVIGEGVTTICMDAFRDAKNLTTAVIAGTVRSIGFHSFDGCTALTQVWLPDSVNVVGEYAFYNCTSLKDVRMGDRIVMIGEYAFANCPIEVLDLPDSLLLMGNHAFVGGKMETVVIPDTITGFGWGAFQNCENLKNLHIPEGVKYSHMDVFQGCKALEMVVVPASMGSIGTMFDRRDNLRTLVYMGDFLGEPFEDYTNADHGRVYTLWYPADNPTWTREARESLDGVITWMPFVKGEDGILTTVVSTEAQVKQTLAELMAQYPEGMKMDPPEGLSSFPEGEFLQSFRDVLLPGLADGPEYRIDFDSVQVGDLIREKSRGFSSDFIYETYIVTEVHADHVKVVCCKETQDYEAYVTWEEILTRDLLENGRPTDFGTRYFTYTSRYQEAQTLELPVIEEPQVDESRFPQEIKTYSAPKLVKPSKFASAGGYANPFVDVKQDRFESAILWAYYNGITTGTTATTFSPEAPCTRKQIVTFLWRYFGSPEPKGTENPFADVPQDRFYKAIMWAYENGITKGTTDTTFGPEEPCTRKQIVTFLWRAAGKQNPLESGNPFTDVPANQFTQAILWAYYKGITTGTTATTFSPEAPCTRKQIVTFLWRFAGEPEYSSGTSQPQIQEVLPLHFACWSTDILMVEGQSCQILFYNDGDDPEKMEITCRDTSLIQVGEKGKITALNPGEAFLYARYEGTGTGVGVKILSMEEAAASEVSISNSGGAFYDGMTLYVGDELSVVFRTDSESGYRGVSITNSNANVVRMAAAEDNSNGYVGETAVTLEIAAPGDTVITVTSPDGTVKKTYRIHVEEYHPFDPGHDELLSPEEFACYASLASGSCGFRVDDSIGGWREGAPLKASELTYDRAVSWGMGSDLHWEVSGYWDEGSNQYGSNPARIFNYVGDREWYDELCYRIQNGF